MALSNIRNFVRRAWFKNISFTPAHAIVEWLPPTGEGVFNLEVEGDHSYVANGIVVHNCDLLSSQNLHGLGDGVYPTRAQTPWPAHPNTLSFIAIVFKDEVSEGDRKGKETPIDALKSLTPEQQRGVLGKGKQELLADGKLRQGMIRTPLGRVRARLDRQRRQV